MEDINYCDPIWKMRRTCQDFSKPRSKVILRDECLKTAGFFVRTPFLSFLLAFFYLP